MKKQKSTKRALLLSALALLMCVSMLIGSTFAWFTDSVTSGSNIIKSGKLDIVMEYWDGTQWIDAEGEVLEFQKADTTAGTEVLWEPGCTYELPKFRIRNEGNLAAKILIKLNNVKGDEKLLEAIDLTTTISNMPESVLNGSYGTQLGKFNNATVGLIYGTPDGTIIFDWSLMGEGVVSPNSGHTDTSPEFTISGHMKEEAGNEYQNLAIEGFSITVLATQEVYEYDSFGREYDSAATFLNKDADGNWLITSAGDLIYFAQQVNGGNSYKGQTILLANDVDLKNMSWQPIGSPAKGFCGTFDGQNHTVSNFKVAQKEYAGLFGYMLNGGNVKNLTVKGATVTATDRAGAVLGAGYTDVVNCHAVDCEITVIPALQTNGEFDGGAKAGGVVGQLFEGASMSIVNCTAKNVKITGYRDIGAVLGMAHDNNTVTDCKAYDSMVSFYYLEPGQKYDGNTPNENIGEVVGRRNSGVVETGTYFENVALNAVLVSNAAEFAEALISGKKVFLTDNITLNTAVTLDKYANIDLNGKTLTTSGMDLTNGGAIANGTVASGGNTYLTPHLKISGGTAELNNVTVNVTHHLNANVNWSEATGIEVQNATAVLNNCNITINNSTRAKWVFSYGISLNNANITVNGGSVTALCVAGTAANGPTNPNAISSIGPCSATLNNVNVTATYYGATVNGHLTINTTDRSVTSAGIVDNRGGSHTVNYID